MNFVSTFRQALESHPAPKRLGDVALRFEPSMLVGETPLPPRSLKPTIAWLVGVSAALFAVMTLTRGDAIAVPTLLAVLAGLGLALAVWLERVDRRRRAFIVNFATTSLRLDFVTPIAGQPKTIIVHFDRVRALGFYRQADARLCLTVDFTLSDSAPESIFREVMVGSIAEEELENAHRLHRVLKGAFGLGEAPADSPLFEKDQFVGTGHQAPRPPG